MANQKRPGQMGDRSNGRNSRTSVSIRGGRQAVKTAAKGSVYDRYHHTADSEKTAVFYNVGSESSEDATVSGKKRPSARSSYANQFSRSGAQYEAKKEMSRNKKIAFGVLSAVLFCILAGGTAFAFYVNDINNRLAGTKTTEEMNAIEEVLAPVASYQEPFYVLLVGSDARSGNSSLGRRSDTNVLVRVDPLNGVVTLVSIPRDTMIDLKGYGRNKFNAAYAYEGIAGAIRETNTLCGVKISHYVEVDFDHFVEVVDVLKGVEVDVEKRISDPKAGPSVIEKGLQTLNGEQALTFARTRQYADGDFTRTSNQRTLIEAILKKVMQTSLPELPGVVQALASSVTTDMKLQDIVGIATQMRNLGDLKIYSAMVPSFTASISEISYVITDKESLKEMMKLVEAGKDPSGVVAKNFSYPGATVTTTTPSNNGGSVTNGDSGGSSTTITQPTPDPGDGGTGDGGNGGDGGDGGSDGGGGGSGGTGAGDGGGDGGSTTP